ncbi:hypothetical protein EMPS_02016 [Entomortierella parvispora]|uniref:Uncharacterized protein n=1 Tax=Entomortierella parvispora TaxID=205924 RepID=A0A9P3LT56_9FUNG|nr:hypothetical protein EMPS_02016 [Entomortierella parvispora]
MDEYSVDTDLAMPIKFDRIPAPCIDDICPIHTQRIPPPNPDRGRSRLEYLVIQKYANVPADTEPQTFRCPLGSCMKTICSAMCLTWKEFAIEIIDHLSFHDFVDHKDETCMQNYIGQPLTKRPAQKRPIAIRHASMSARRRLLDMPRQKGEERHVLNIPLYWALKEKAATATRPVTRSDSLRTAAPLTMAMPMPTQQPRSHHKRT